MSVLIDIDTPAAAREAKRRQMLAESDLLLDQVERLRLADQAVCPPALAEALRALQLRLGRVDPHQPRTLRAAHHLVFAVQARLMAANPSNPQPRSQLDRPSGQPRIALLRHGGAWKFLALPPRPSSAEQSAQAEWRLLVHLTVERALDRWSCAQDQAVNAVRTGSGVACALHRARAAWRNYWDLHCEAELLLSHGRAPEVPAARPP